MPWWVQGARLRTECTGAACASCVALMEDRLERAHGDGELHSFRLELPPLDEAADGRHLVDLAERHVGDD